jgi:PKD domain./Protein of unknown function (DUF1566).
MKSSFPKLPIGLVIFMMTISVARSVAAQVCSGAPSNNTITASCTTNCKSGVDIQFTPYAWGYTYQTCDTFAWSFGDGYSSNVKSPKHMYSNNGIYTVRLTVTNSNGSDSTTMSLTIGNATQTPACGDQNGDGAFGPADVFYLVNYMFASGPGPTNCPPTLTPNSSTVQQLGGLYAPFDLSLVDPDLQSANVRAGVSVFGVAGDGNVVNTTSGDASPADIASGKKAWVKGVEVTGSGIISPAFPAPVPRSGITWCLSDGIVVSCTGTGQDGDTQKGVPIPNPRFTVNNDGTVTDNLTGLVWLRDAGCMGGRTWSDSLSRLRALASGACGLIDNSLPGEWRLPNVKELQSLINYDYSNPALSNTAGTGRWTEGAPFFAVQSTWFWSSTPAFAGGSGARIVLLQEGSTAQGMGPYYIWPVRDPH